MQPYNIRVATLDDLNEIERKCYEFYKESPYSHLEYSRSKTISTIEEVIQSDKTEAICLLSEGGILAARVVSVPFTEIRVATEQVWWISPHLRGTREALYLLDAYEYWAWNVAKVDGCQMVCLETLAPEKVGKLYERKGFIPIERAYIKWKTKST